MTYSDCLSDGLLITIGQRLCKTGDAAHVQTVAMDRRPAPLTEVGARAVLQSCCA
jgi:hypothetical protein